MGTDCNVTLRASCANQPDELHVYSRQVAKGILLLELLKRLALGAALCSRVPVQPGGGTPVSLSSADLERPDAFAPRVGPIHHHAAGAGIENRPLCFRRLNAKLQKEVPRMLGLPMNSFIFYIVVQVVQIVGVIGYGIYWFSKSKNDTSR